MQALKVCAVGRHKHTCPVSPRFTPFILRFSSQSASKSIYMCVCFNGFLFFTIRSCQYSEMEQNILHQIRRILFDAKGKKSNLSAGRYLLQNAHMKTCAQTSMCSALPSAGIPDNATNTNDREKKTTMHCRNVSNYTALPVLAAHTQTHTQNARSGGQR